MKNPWVAFAGICSLVIAIVLFSVIFGGYSSFLRSQKRIEAAKQLVVDQCRLELDIVGKLIEQLTVLPDAASPQGENLLVTFQQALPVVGRLEKTQMPAAPELISEFSLAQSRMNQAANALITRLDTPDTAGIIEKIQAAQAGVYTAGRRYNKEARYFNTRTRVFPGFIVAKIFGFDTLYFKEMSTDLLKPLAGREDSGAS